MNTSHEYTYALARWLEMMDDPTKTPGDFAKWLAIHGKTWQEWIEMVVTTDAESAAEEANWNPPPIPDPSDKEAYEYYLQQTQLISISTVEKAP